MKPNPSLSGPVTPAGFFPPITNRGQAVIVGGLLLLYIFLAVSATTNKSTAFDEIGHLTSGYLYWTQPTHHLEPENGIVAQGWAALPLLFDHLKAPSETGEPWGTMGFWGQYYRFFYSAGNDPGLMLFQGRAMISLLGAALGALVFLWSREFFGAWGGLISLLLFVFCPTMLAHGALVTADMAATLGFFATTFCFWKLSHVVTWRTLLLSVLALTFLVLSKMSAVLIVPILGLILLVRFCSSRPVEIRFRLNKTVGDRSGRLGIWSLLLAVHLAVVIGSLWLFYDFTYLDVGAANLRSQALYAPDFAFFSGSGLKATALQLFADMGFLPPAYLEGLSDSLLSADLRNAFLWGNYSQAGWWWFFPFAFLIKTPIASLLLFFFSLVALALWKWFPRYAAVHQEKIPPRPGLYDFTPLLILGGVYGLACLTSHINIGHRHMMPVYPVLFVFAGANVFWLLQGKRFFQIAVAILVSGTAIESLAAWPNYIAFFNPLIGGPRNGYHYLIDSSLDWGQDLPGLHQWLEKNVPAGGDTRIYLSYFGTGDPKFYDINALTLPGFFDTNAPQTFPLQGGIYCVSATMLQSDYTHYYGLWTPAYETLYNEAQAEMKRWDATSSDAAARARLISEKGEDYWTAVASAYGELRFVRLCAYLRHRKPDDEVGYSILIYRLSDEDLERAISEPPLE